MIWNHRFSSPILVILISIFLGACGVYSFTGTNISPEVETITVANFPNLSGSGPADLSQIFTEGLRETYQQNTNLEVVMDAADLTINGEITSYTISPVAPTADEVAAINRLRIKVRVNYYNRVDPDQDFENREFSFFDDFEQQQSIQEVEEDLIDVIFTQIYLEIFTETVANW